MLDPPRSAQRTHGRTAGASHREHPQPPDHAAVQHARVRLQRHTVRFAEKLLQSNAL
jgi:hypothetical protein